MSLKNEKYKNKLETEPERKKKFGKEFAEIPKGKHYVEELEPLIGAAVDLECDDWVFIPGELGGIPCEKPVSYTHLQKDMRRDVLAGWSRKGAYWLPQNV